MWTLRSSPASPFGRKVKIGAALCGLSDKMLIEPTDTGDVAGTLTQQNPLGKIPTLVLDDGTALYDSRVILEYLDEQAGGCRIIPAGAARFQALTLQSLSDGILDANILIIYEGRYRTPEKHHQPWVDRQAGKIARAIDALEASPPRISSAPHVGHIALACALGHRDFRFQGDWRASHPQLVEWLDSFAAAVPSFETTKPH